MKTKYIALALGALLAGMAFTSCSKDGSEDIIGTWQRTALYWTYSGSPNASSNYSSGGPMDGLAGASDMKFVFNGDKTGMIIEEWFSGPDEHGINTTYFTYTIDGDEGIMTMQNEEKEASWTSTYTIQKIKEESMVVYEKTVAENYQEYVGNTSPYTRVVEHWHHCKKIK